MFGRTCYLSEPKGSAEDFIRKRIKQGHESIIEHEKVTVRIICDRGISHELVRHRLSSFSQESTRYCNYSMDKFGSEITFIEPCFFEKGSKEFLEWEWLCQKCEDTYFSLIDKGRTPQEARSVLPNSLKTELIMTCNLREWRHFFKLRALGLQGKPHPQMLEIAVPMLKDFQKLLPAIFSDLELKE